MEPKNLPPALLVALGLVACSGDEGKDTSTSVCLDYATDSTTTSVCLTQWTPSGDTSDTGTSVCLDYAYPTAETAETAETAGGTGDTAQSASAAGALERLEGTLPADVLARLRKG